MSRLTARRRFVSKAIAAALAVGYVFLAAVGDGLHRLACISGGCDAVCCQTLGGDSGDVDCLFCHHGDRCQEQETTPGIQTGDRQPADDPQPHDSDCDVCRLLAKLKTASTTVEVPAQVIWATAPTRPESDPKAPSLYLPAMSARGPPIA